MQYFKLEETNKMGTRIQALRNNVKDLNTCKRDKTITIEKFIVRLNTEGEAINDYSKKKIILTYNKSSVSKIEHNEQYPSTDFLYLAHRYFNRSLQYLAFGETLPTFENFEKIYKRLNEKQQDLLVDKCIKKSVKIFIKDRENESEQNEKFIDYRTRLNEIREYSRLTNMEFCRLIGTSKNTMDKYHTQKIRQNSDEYLKRRNSALEYLIKVCCGIGVYLDYLLEGTYYNVNYPIELSNELFCYNYAKQVHILKLWLEEAKFFEKRYIK